MYAQNSLPTDSTTGPFPIGFNYLDAATISVTQYDLDGVSTPIAKTFTFAGTVSEDQPSGSTIVLDVAIASGKIIKIAKTVDMDTPALIWNQGAEITQKNLRKSTRNLMEMAQAAWDYASKAYAPIVELVDLVASAGASATASAASAVASAASLGLLADELALTTAQKVLAQAAAAESAASAVLADSDRVAAAASALAADASADSIAADYATIDVPTIQRTSGKMVRPAVVAKVTTFTVEANEYSFKITPTVAMVVTLPDAASNTGRILKFINKAAFAITSASANVLPRTTNTAGTAMLAATAGAWCELQSNGTVWETISAG